MAEDTYPVRADYGNEYPMTREMIRRTLDSDLPDGMDCLFHSFSYALLSVDDFFAACRHLGMDHLLFDIEYDEVKAELEARRARGAPPTDRELPSAINSEANRELADAMLDAYERRVADAEAMAAARAAARRGARRLPEGDPASRLPPPRTAEGEACPLRDLGARELATREGTRHLLGLVAPHGRAYMVYHLLSCGLGISEFEGACHHFGMDHLLFDVPVREVLAELEARRARGAPPTGRELPVMMGEEEREYADAMLDVHARKAAEAEARAALKVAPAAS